MNKMAYCEVPDTTEIHVRKAGDMPDTFFLIDYHDDMPNSCSVYYVHHDGNYDTLGFNFTREEANILRDAEEWKLVKTLKKRWFDHKDPLGEGNEPHESELGRLHLEKEYQ